jgi:peptidoglycan/LPS O-acetylase OafA/YrhL
MGLKYEPALDGLRAIAATMVLLHHAHVPGFAGGGRGVDVFFVLSGYLITNILVSEARATGQIDVTAFWLRRARRLVPALIAVILVSGLLVNQFPPEEVPRMGAAMLFAATYTTNIASCMGFALTPLSHTWTLALEMQFYLIWPFVVGFVAKVRRPAVALFAAWIAVTATSGAVGQLPTLKAFQWLFSVGPLIFGSALAFTPPMRPAIGWLGATIVLAMTFVPSSLRPQLLNHLPLLDMGAGMLISSLSHDYRLSRALGWAPLVWLGAISYGIYLWHFPILEVLRGQGWQLRVLVAAPLSIAMARLSYLTVETWGRAIGRRPAAELG